MLYRLLSKIPVNTIVLSITVISCSGLSQADSLVDVYELALINDPTLQAAEASYKRVKKLSHKRFRNCYRRLMVVPVILNRTVRAAISNIFQRVFPRRLQTLIQKLKRRLTRSL